MRLGLLINHNLGFRLGLLGLSIFTLGFALAGLQVNSVGVYLLGVIALWVGYLLFGKDIQYRSRSFSLILGLFFLTVPPVYIWSYNSVSYTRADLVSITRSTSPEDKTVTLTLEYDTYSNFNPFPVIVPDVTLYLHNINVDPTVFAVTCKGGTLYPFGHLRCHSTAVIPAPSSNNFTGNVIGFDLSISLLGGQDIPTVSSLLYSQRFDSFGSYPFCWNMTANARTPFSIGPGPGYAIVCS